MFGTLIVHPNDFADEVFAEIPPGLDDMEPGPILAGFLASIDVDAASGYDQVAVLRAHHRMATHYAAHTYSDMVAVTATMGRYQDKPEDAAEGAAAEIRLALNLTRRAADVELSFALDLSRRLPRIFAMLTEGRIDVRRAKTIDTGTMHLSPAVAQDVVERIIDVAPDLTTGELGARIRKLCIEVAPAEAEQIYEHATRNRAVVMTPNPSGTANLTGHDLPPDRVAGITTKINKIARTLRRGGETRTMDQLRADVYLDLLDGTSAAADSSRSTLTGTRRGVVDIRVDLDTLTGLTDRPGELAGYGPVISDIACQIAERQHDSEWRVTITNTHTGEPTHITTTTRRPTATQKRRIETRNRVCVFPGCRMPALDSDVDHTTPIAEHGTTTDMNLAPICRHDHQIRHRHGWTYTKQPDHTHHWTTKLGHTYTTTPNPP